MDGNPHKSVRLPRHDPPPRQVVVRRKRRRAARSALFATLGAAVAWMLFTMIDAGLTKR